MHSGLQIFIRLVVPSGTVALYNNKDYIVGQSKNIVKIFAVDWGRPQLIGTMAEMSSGLKQH